MPSGIKCPVCRSCMSLIYVDLKRYLFCGFCHTYRQGSNDNLQIVESPFKDRVLNPKKVYEPNQEQEEYE